MKRLLLLQVIWLNIIFQGFAQTTDCKRLLDTKLEKIIPDQYAIETIIKQLLECQYIDTIDVAIIPSIIITKVNTAQTVKDWVDEMNKFKKTEDYNKIISIKKLCDELKWQEVNLKEWDDKKKQLVTCGVPESDLPALKTFIRQRLKNAKRAFIYWELVSEFFTLKKKNVKTQPKQEGIGIKVDTTKSPNCGKRSLTDKFHSPYGLKAYYDYQEALACAQKLNRPVFVDFTGHGCVNCRKMELSIWSDPKVLQLLNEKFVIVSLYVDDRSTLPKEKWYVSSEDNREKKTIGQQNFDLQMRKFNTNAQPNYHIINPYNEQELTKAFGYTKSTAKFLEFLDKGLKSFKK
ncbi:hypothetical protein BKI52_36080 [marine bacterium AO1-C]|nr:hypothetical protein BKI52_36080 [marine bacterium AO1-C]